MPSPSVVVGGARWKLPAIRKLTKAQARSLWPRRRQRVLVIRLFVQYKLAQLRKQGVTWKGVNTSSRLSFAKFAATRKREHRIVQGRAFSKKTPSNWSHYVRFKCATHLTLCGRVDDVVWETLDDRSYHDRGWLSASDILFLLAPYRHLALPRHAWAHLRRECQTGAKCSWGFVFGLGEMGI